MGIWSFFIQILVSVALSLIAYVISPKPKPQRPKEIDPALLEEPTAEVGRPVPVVFGSVTVQSPNVLDTTDKSQIRHKNRKENPNTSTYHLSVHYAICHGPVDCPSSRSYSRESGIRCGHGNGRHDSGSELSRVRRGS